MGDESELRRMGSELTELKNPHVSGDRYTRLYQQFLQLYLDEQAWTSQVIDDSFAEDINSRGHYHTFITQDRPRHYYAYNGRWRWLQVGMTEQWRQERVFGGRWTRMQEGLHEVEPPYYVKLHYVGTGHDLWREAWLEDRRLGIWQARGTST